MDSESFKLLLEADGSQYFATLDRKEHAEQRGIRTTQSLENSIARLNAKLEAGLNPTRELMATSDALYGKWQHAAPKIQEQWVQLNKRADAMDAASRASRQLAQAEENATRMMEGWTRASALGTAATNEAVVGYERQSGSLKLLSEARYQDVLASARQRDRVIADEKLKQDAIKATEIAERNAVTGRATRLQNMGRLGSGLRNAGQAINRNVGLPVAGIVGYAGYNAMNLEQDVANIATIKQIDQEKTFSQLNDMQRHVRFNSQRLAEELYDIYSSIDIPATKGIALLEKFTKGATGGRTDIQVWGTSVMGVMNAYGRKIEDVDHIQDLFFNTIKEGVVTGTQLASNLGLVTQFGRQAGATMEEEFAAISAVTKEGGQAEQNINNMANLFLKLYGPKALEGWRHLGIDIKDASGHFKPFADNVEALKSKLDELDPYTRKRYIQKMLPDMQAQAGLTTLMHQFDFFKQQLHTNETQAGATDAAFKKASDTAQTKMVESLNKVNAKLNDISLKYLPKIADGFESIGKYIDGLDPKTVEWGLKVGALVAVGGPVLSLTASIINLVTWINRFKNTGDAIGGATWFGKMFRDKSGQPPLPLPLPRQTGPQSADPSKLGPLGAAAWPVAAIAGSVYGGHLLGESMFGERRKGEEDWMKNQWSEDQVLFAQKARIYARKHGIDQMVADAGHMERPETSFPLDVAKSVAEEMRTKMLEPYIDAMRDGLDMFGAVLAGVKGADSPYTAANGGSKLDRSSADEFLNGGAESTAAKTIRQIADAVDTPAGKASCAYFGSKVLQGLGYNMPDIGSAKGFADYIKSHGGKEESVYKASPGDVIVYRGASYGAIDPATGKRSGYHIGIAMGGGRETWSTDGVTHYGKIYDPKHAYALHLPGTLTPDAEMKALDQLRIYNELYKQMAEGKMTATQATKKLKDMEDAEKAAIAGVTLENYNALEVAKHRMDNENLYLKNREKEAKRVKALFAEMKRDALHHPVYSLSNIHKGARPLSMNDLEEGDFYQTQALFAAMRREARENSRYSLGNLPRGASNMRSLIDQPGKDFAEQKLKDLQDEEKAVRGLISAYGDEGKAARAALVIELDRPGVTEAIRSQILAEQDLLTRMKGYQALRDEISAGLTGAAMAGVDAILSPPHRDTSGLRATKLELEKALADLDRRYSTGIKNEDTARAFAHDRSLLNAHLRSIENGLRRHNNSVGSILRNAASAFSQSFDKMIRDIERKEIEKVVQRGAEKLGKSILEIFGIHEPKGKGKQEKIAKQDVTTATITEASYKSATFDNAVINTAGSSSSSAGFAGGLPGMIFSLFAHHSGGGSAAGAGIGAALKHFATGGYPDPALPFYVHRDEVVAPANQPVRVYNPAETRAMTHGPSVASHVVNEGDTFIVTPEAMAMSGRNDLRIGARRLRQGTKRQVAQNRG